MSLRVTIHFLNGHNEEMTESGLKGQYISAQVITTERSDGLGKCDEYESTAHNL